MRSRQGGFSLLEVLVAMLILALALTALYKAFGTAQTNLSKIEGHVAARELARSVLEEETTFRGVRRQPRKGRWGPYSWTLLVRIADEELAPVPSVGGWTLYELVVEVTWGRRHRTELRTLQLARSAPS